MNATMIAPDARLGKSLADNAAQGNVVIGSAMGSLRGCRRCDKLAASPHRFVNRIIMLPDSGQAHAKLKWE